MLIKEMLELEKTIDVIERFRKNHPDTLVVLTADHETGGLMIDENSTTCLGKEQCIPKVKWTSAHFENEPVSKHTNKDVPLYSIGVASERFCKPNMDNTEILSLALGG